MSMPARLEIDATGRLRGSVPISYNDPWPCRNGYTSGFKSPARGVVIHTEQGFEQGTISWFNNPASQASAWFAVGLDGSIWQFAPVGSGWCSWAQVDGNDDFYSIEDADNGDPSTPFPPLQVQSIALVVEVLSRHDGFPLAVATDPFTQRGVTLHSEGGEAFGGHLECPGSVRGAQRPQIIALAASIRAGGTPAPPAKAATVPSVIEWTTAGQESLAQLAAAHHCEVSAILRLTAERSPGAIYEPAMASVINETFARDSQPMPAGLKLYLPA